MKLAYKILPVTKPHPAFPKETSIWCPLLSVKLSYGHGAQSPRFEAIVDTGADTCVFRSDIASRIGIKDVTSGIHSTIGGINATARIDAYYHRVKLWVAADCLTIMAGFAANLPVAGLLGRRGFFEHYVVTFDPSNNPPGFELKRIGRA